MRSILVLSALVAGSLAPAFLQDASKSTQSSTSQNTRTTDREARLDGFLANWLVIDGKNEVAIAEIAQQKAQDPEVKRFAQKMIEDHRQFADKLQPFASKEGSSMSYSGGTDGNGGTDGGADGNAESSQANKSSTGSEYGYENSKNAIFQELAQQCLDSTRKELNQHTGADFDRCFMGMMVGDHMKANDMLMVFQRHVSGNLKTVLSEGQSTIAMHLDQAKELKRKLEGTIGAARGG